MKNVTINGVNSTQKKLDPVYNGKTSIFDLYTKPSQEKIEAFYEWQGKLDYIHGIIGSTHNFSIFGVIKDENGAKHHVKITKSYNYILD